MFLKKLDKFFLHRLDALADQAKAHLLIAPSGAADAILFKNSVDIGIPFELRFEVSAVKYTILTAIKRCVVLFGVGDCRLEEPLEKFGAERVERHIVNT